MNLLRVFFPDVPDRVNVHLLDTSLEKIWYELKDRIDDTDLAQLYEDLENINFELSDLEKQQKMGIDDPRLRTF